MSVEALPVTERKVGVLSANRQSPVFGFQFVNKAHVSIIILTPMGKLASVLVNGRDFSVTPNEVAGRGGTVSWLVPEGEAVPVWLYAVGTDYNLTADYVALISRQTPVTQEAEFNNAGSFTQKSREDALDKLTLVDQELKARLDEYPPPGEIEEQVDNVAENSVQTGDDRRQTGEDRVQTGDDRRQTEEDRVQTGDDRRQTGEDRVQTGDDRRQTEEDRVQTGDDSEESRKWAGAGGWDGLPEQEPNLLTQESGTDPDVARSSREHNILSRRHAVTTSTNRLAVEQALGLITTIRDNVQDLLNSGDDDLTIEQLATFNLLGTIENLTPSQLVLLGMTTAFRDANPSRTVFMSIFVNSDGTRRNLSGTFLSNFMYQIIYLVDGGGISSAAEQLARMEILRQEIDLIAGVLRTDPVKFRKVVSFNSAGSSVVTDLINLITLLFGDEKGWTKDIAHVSLLLYLMEYEGREAPPFGEMTDFIDVFATRISRTGQEAVGDIIDEENSGDLHGTLVDHVIYKVRKSATGAVRGEELVFTSNSREVIYDLDWIVPFIPGSSQIFGHGVTNIDPVRTSYTERTQTFQYLYSKTLDFLNIGRQSATTIISQQEINANFYTQDTLGNYTIPLDFIRMEIETETRNSENRLVPLGTAINTAGLLQTLRSNASARRIIRENLESESLITFDFRRVAVTNFNGDSIASTATSPRAVFKAENLGTDEFINSEIIDAWLVPRGVSADSINSGFTYFLLRLTKTGFRREIKELKLGDFVFSNFRRDMPIDEDGNFAPEHNGLYLVAGPNYVDAVFAHRGRTLRRLAAGETDASIAEDRTPGSNDIHNLFILIEQLFLDRDFNIQDSLRNWTWVERGNLEVEVRRRDSTPIALMSGKRVPGTPDDEVIVGFELDNQGVITDVTSPYVNHTHFSAALAGEFRTIADQKGDTTKFVNQHIDTFNLYLRESGSTSTAAIQIITTNRAFARSVRTIINLINRTIKEIPANRFAMTTAEFPLEEHPSATDTVYILTTHGEHLSLVANFTDIFDASVGIGELIASPRIEIPLEFLDVRRRPIFFGTHSSGILHYLRRTGAVPQAADIPAQDATEDKIAIAAEENGIRKTKYVTASAVKGLSAGDGAVAESLNVEINGHGDRNRLEIVVVHSLIGNAGRAVVAGHEYRLGGDGRVREVEQRGDGFFGNGFFNMAITSGDEEDFEDIIDSDDQDNSKVAEFSGLTGKVLTNGNLLFITVNHLRFHSGNQSWKFNIIEVTRMLQDGAVTYVEVGKWAGTPHAHGATYPIFKDVGIPAILGLELTAQDTVMMTFFFARTSTTYEFATLQGELSLSGGDYQIDNRNTNHLSDTVVPVAVVDNDWQPRSMVLIDTGLTQGNAVAIQFLALMGWDKAKSANTIRYYNRVLNGVIDQAGRNLTPHTAAVTTAEQYLSHDLSAVAIRKPFAFDRQTFSYNTGQVASENNPIWQLATQIRTSSTDRLVTIDGNSHVVKKITDILVSYHVRFRPADGAILSGFDFLWTSDPSLSSQIALNKRGVAENKTEIANLSTPTVSQTLVTSASNVINRPDELMPFSSSLRGNGLLRIDSANTRLVAIKRCRASCHMDTRENNLANEVAGAIAHRDLNNNDIYAANFNLQVGSFGEGGTTLDAVLEVGDTLHFFVYRAVSIRSFAVYATGF